MAGLTLICNVHGYLIADGERIPDEGKLTYRGIDVRDIVEGCQKENRFGLRRLPGSCSSASSRRAPSWIASPPSSTATASCPNILPRT